MRSWQDIDIGKLSAAVSSARHFPDPWREIRAMGTVGLECNFIVPEAGKTIMDLNERLAAIEEIKALKARYFRCMDNKDWPGLQAVFAPDVVCDFRDSTGTRDESLLTHGAALYVKNLAPILQNIVTTHHGHMPEIEIISP